MINILIFCHSKLFSNNNLISAIGSRYLEIGHALEKRGYYVTLAEQEHITDYFIGNINIIGWTKKNIISITENFDFCILPQTMAPFFLKRKITTPLIVDLIVPLQMELCISSSINKIPTNIIIQKQYATAVSLLLGDFFLCGGEKQKWYYIGMMVLLGRINPNNFQDPPIGIVPQGSKDFNQNEQISLLKGKIVGNDARIILWMGGIYPWYNVDSLIFALRDVIKSIPNIRLVFVGANNPMDSQSIPGYQNAVHISKDLNLLDKYIFFTDWIPYDLRHNLYSESELMICIYEKSLETELSSRTRVIDALMGGLPVIVSGGDEISEVIKKYDAGRIIEEEGKSLAELIISILTDPNLQKQMSCNAKNLAIEKFSWDYIVDPIDKFCMNPPISSNKSSYNMYTAIYLKSMLYNSLKNKLFYGKKWLIAYLKL